MCFAVVESNKISLSVTEFVLREYSVSVPPLYSSDVRQRTNGLLHLNF